MHRAWTIQTVRGRRAWIGMLCLAVSLLGVLTLGISPVGAQPSTVALTGRVVDTADILSAATEQTLSAELAAFEDATTHQIVVLTIPALGVETIESYAGTVFNAWGLGQQDADNGVLLLVARDDRELRIEVGYGLEGTLTDALAGRIIRHVIVPHFRDGDFDAGVTEGVHAIVGVIHETYVPPEDASDDMPWWGRLLFAAFFVVIPLLQLPTALLSPGCSRYFLALFFLPFVGAGTFVVTMMPAVVVVVAVLYLLGFVAADVYLARSAWGRQQRARVAEAVKKGTTAKVRMGGMTFAVGGSSSGGSSGSSFSGGGGSSGGGGASGSW